MFFKFVSNVFSKMCIVGKLSIKVVVKGIKGILEIKLHKLSVIQAAQSVTSGVK